MDVNLDLRKLNVSLNVGLTFLACFFCGVYFGRLVDHRALLIHPATAHLDCPVPPSGSWQLVSQCPNPLPENVAFCNDSLAISYFGQSFLYQWVLDASKCGARRLSNQDVLQILRNKSIHLVGDSHIRFFENALSDLVLGTHSETHDHLGHRVYQNSEFNITVSWQWSAAVQHAVPFIASALTGQPQRHQMHVTSMKQSIDANGTLADAFSKWSRSELPDIVVVDGSLFWHLLANRNATDWVLQVQFVKNLTTQLVSMAPHTLFVWLSTPPVHPSTGDPTNFLQIDYVPLFNRIVAEEQMLQPSGPYHLLDLYTLANECLHWCMKKDGVHVLYEINQIMVQQLAHIVLLLNEPTTQG